MKKSYIKTSTNLISDLSYLRAWRQNSNEYYLGIDKISEIIQNSFVRTCFTCGHKIEETENDSFGITYKRTATSIVYKILNKIAEEVSKMNLLNEKQEKIDFILKPANENKYLTLAWFHLTILNETYYKTINEYMIIINEAICLYIDRHLEELNPIINSCLNGEIPFFIETITITDENDFPYFTYESTVSFDNNEVFNLVNKLDYYNPYNIKKLNDFVESRNKKLDFLNSLFHKNITPAEIHKQRNTGRLNSFFSKIDIIKTLEIPKEENNNKVFKDENAVFKINENYEDLSGTISLDRFMELKNKIKSPTKMYNFINVLELI